MTLARIVTVKPDTRSPPSPYGNETLTPIPSSDRPVLEFNNTTTPPILFLESSVVRRRSFPAQCAPVASVSGRASSSVCESRSVCLSLFCLRHQPHPLHADSSGSSSLPRSERAFASPPLVDSLGADSLFWTTAHPSLSAAQFFLVAPRALHPPGPCVDYCPGPHFPCI